MQSEKGQVQEVWGRAAEDQKQIRTSNINKPSRSSPNEILQSWVINTFFPLKGGLLEGGGLIWERGLNSRLDFRRLPGPVFDPPRKELFWGMSAGSFSRTAAGNWA